MPKIKEETEMYIFEAHYENMDTNEKRVQSIEFDGGNFFDTEKECYIYAMTKAYENKKENECLVSVEFIAC